MDGGAGPFVSFDSSAGIQEQPVAKNLSAIMQKQSVTDDKWA